MIGTVVRLLGAHRAPFVYVDCGARGEHSNRLVDLLPGARYVGFEPDAEACAMLRDKAKPGYLYMPTAAGAACELRTLNVTANPACSSLRAPNGPFFGQFLDCAAPIEVRSRQQVPVDTLDSCLPAAGVDDVDFIELDTQGTELEVLHGAAGFLGSCVVGVRVEVEFAPIYEGQALFSEVDVHLRTLGFTLFDLSRHRYRRQHYPRQWHTRGQLLYGQALYLKDQRALASRQRRDKLCKLGIVAAFNGFHDYACEVLDLLLAGDAGPLQGDEQTALAEARAVYRAYLGNRSRALRAVARLEKSPLRRLVLSGVRAATKLAALHSSINEKSNASWSD